MENQVVFSQLVPPFAKRLMKVKVPVTDMFLENGIEVCQNCANWLGVFKVWGLMQLLCSPSGIDYYLCDFFYINIFINFSHHLY